MRRLSLIALTALAACGGISVSLAQSLTPVAQRSNTDINPRALELISASRPNIADALTVTQVAANPAVSPGTAAAYAAMPARSALSLGTNAASKQVTAQQMALQTPSKAASVETAQNFAINGAPARTDSAALRNLTVAPIDQNQLAARLTTSTSAVKRAPSKAK